MAYGFWSDMALFSEDFSWFGARRFDIATIRTLFARRDFEAELQFVPAEDAEELVRNREKCFSRYVYFLLSILLKISHKIYISPST